MYIWVFCFCFVFQDYPADFRDFLNKKIKRVISQNFSIFVKGCASLGSLVVGGRLEDEE